MNAEDRRGRRRFEAPKLDASLNRRPVTVRNISLSGLGFETTEHLQLRSRYVARVRTELGELTVAGRVIWCHLAATVRGQNGDVCPLYRAGLRFDPLTGRDAEILIKFLERVARWRAATAPAEVPTKELDRQAMAERLRMEKAVGAAHGDTDDSDDESPRRQNGPSRPTRLRAAPVH